MINPSEARTQVSHSVNPETPPKKKGRSVGLRISWLIIKLIFVRVLQLRKLSRLSEKRTSKMKTAVINIIVNTIRIARKGIGRDRLRDKDQLSKTFWKGNNRKLKCMRRFRRNRELNRKKID